MLEPESAALRAFLASRTVLASSVVSQIEVARSVRRRNGAAAAGPHLEATWLGISWLAVDSVVIRGAGQANPPELRSVDAIHLASALLLGEDLAGMVVYDARLAAAAQALGILVFAPK